MELQWMMAGRTDEPAEIVLGEGSRWGRLGGHTLILAGEGDRRGRALARYHQSAYENYGY